jgi:uncharacterized protein DUF5615
VSVAIYMDEHVHRAITAGLRLRAVDVVTAQEDGRRKTDDDLLLDRAGELGRVLFSQDEDLLAEAKRRQEQGIAFAGVVYGHQLRVTIGLCVRDLNCLPRPAIRKTLSIASNICRCEPFRCRRPGRSRFRCELPRPAGPSPFTDYQSSLLFRREHT